MKQELEPLDDHVAIAVNKSAEVTPGGIVLPDAAQDRENTGTVKAVGPGKILQSGIRAPMTLHVGDTVVFTQYGGTEIEFDGQLLKLLKESDILARTSRGKKS